MIVKKCAKQHNKDNHVQAQGSKLIHMLMNQGKLINSFNHNYSLFLRIGVHFEEESVTKCGYLANCKPTTHTDQNGAEVAALLLYFIQDDGAWFKALKIYEPYFLLECQSEVI